LRWLYNALSPGFLASYWSAGFGIGTGIALASHCLEDCANFTPTMEENDQYNANHSHPVQYKHQAKLLFSMNNFSPLVISTSDKNKQLTLVSQRKLALTGKICKWFCQFGGTSKKLKPGATLLQAYIY
jgi:hypothetical protein